MVESQVRPSDVTDRRITKAMSDIPREVFVPEAMQSLAYMDTAVALTAEKPGQRQARTLMAPRTFAKLVQLLDLSEKDVVLDVGCATGYSTAILSSIAETVVALESDAALAEQATEVLSNIGRDNAAVVVGPLKDGYPSEGPYDAIFVGGEVPAVPDGLLDQLKDGGVLVTIVADGKISRAIVWQRTGETFDRREAFEASAAPLPGFERKTAFAL